MKTKTIIKRLSAVLILFFTLGSLFLVYHRYYKVTYTPQKYIESTRKIYNPYQGWYRIYGYTLSDDKAIDPASISSSYQHDPDTTIALLEINLRNYPSGDISSTALKQLDTIFSTWKKSNKQLIVRFLYDWNGKAKETEPDNISIIKSHMAQVAPIVNQKKDCIYILQSIFVGNCGEMNNSNYMSKTDMCTLFSQLASVTNPSIFLAVRTPAHWRTIAQSFQPLTKEQAFSGSPTARLGLFNDGMLGSVYDLGTYGDTSLSQADSYDDKGTRAEEIAFQNQLCSYVPNGGEVVLDNPFNNLDNAVKDLGNMHVSYLDYDYDAAVLNKWKATTYTGTDAFHGCSGYDYITNHLGYRYVVQSSDVTFDTWKNDAATLDISLKNTGFSNCYRAFQTTVILKNTKTNHTYKIAVDSDTRYWKSNELVNFSVPLAIRSYAHGSYNVYLKITDPVSGIQIQLANDLKSSDTGYNIASLKIAK